MAALLCECLRLLTNFTQDQEPFAGHAPTLQVGASAPNLLVTRSSLSSSSLHSSDTDANRAPLATHVSDPETDLLLKTSGCGNPLLVASGDPASHILEGSPFGRDTSHLKL